MGTAASSALGRLGLPAPRLPAPSRPAWLGVAALGLGAVALGTVAWRRARSRRRRRLQQVGTVAQLWIYPVKSCKGVPVSAAECTALGLRSGHLRDRVHGLEIEGRDCGDAAAQWITSFLKTQPYRLVHFEPHLRPRNSHQILDAFRPTDQVAYSDASPFLILSEASLADLNSRLEKKVKVTNFRPNIVISGCGVYAEDSWDELLIGDVILKRIMACSRCVLTTVDPDTGIMNRKEPLETLKSAFQRINKQEGGPKYNVNSAKRTGADGLRELLRAYWFFSLSAAQPSFRRNSFHVNWKR
ncbi:mitochondrial amidoxime-reducing component 1 isoform X5 [Ursus arctos]|uniref:mitochondrial amidoxime-reducing component 1 isoform X5 n=1 Tax=Ursus arctos TaxID=9644 RepID=UPI002547C456|nr:mitochondrial amidoxime-reducing component 1 isoform X5 [Ursus arctos]